MSRKTDRNWWKDGVESGWIGRYEQELIYYLEREFGEMTENEKLCAVFASLFVKSGHVALPLDRTVTEWGEIVDLEKESIELLPENIDLNTLKNGNHIGKNGEMKPFILDDESLSIRRYREQEKEVIDWISDRSTADSPPVITNLHKQQLDKLFPSPEDGIDWQKIAVAMSVIKPFLIISGGPGTGKTTTVAKILAMHLRLAERPLKIALAAPTGKAAGRMGEALMNQLQTLGLSDEELDRFPDEAKTVHRLLYGKEERGLLPSARREMLNYDLVIVDEASMIDLTLMNRLLRHVGPNTKLIFLGDKDQLSSVEAGAVFSDLCQKQENGFTADTANLLKQFDINGQLPEAEQSSLDDSIVYLTKSYRFGEDSGIGRLAQLVKSGRAEVESVDEIFSSFDELEHRSFSYDTEDLEFLSDHMNRKAEKLKELRSPESLIGFWKESAWLTLHRRGLDGSEYLNSMIENSLVRRHTVTAEHGWYHGRPIIVTRNDYNLGIFNGDMGVCVEENGAFWVYIESGSELKRVSPQRLLHIQPAYFLTVHKSQGSEFNHVHLLFPRQESQLLSRELLYTAITRSREKFTCHGNLKWISSGADQPLKRYTGLSKMVKTLG